MTKLDQQTSTQGADDQIGNNQSILLKPNHILRRIFGKIDPPVPANDNIRNRKSYGQAARNHAGSPYQSAGTKMWWLP